MSLWTAGVSDKVKSAGGAAQAENDLLRANMNVQYSTGRAADDAAEYTGFLTMGNLGQPGTYEDPYSSTSTSYWGVPTASSTGANKGGTGGLLGYQTSNKPTSATSWSSDSIFDQSAADVIKLGYALNTNQANATQAIYKDQGADAAKKYVRDQLSQGGQVNINEKALDQYVQNPMGGGDYKLKYWNKTGAAGRVMGQYTPPILDPYAASKAIGETRTGRMVSYATAQADEFLRGSGPLKALWDEQVLDPIYQAAAQTTREAIVQIDRDMNQGGADARRVALATSRKLVAQEAINRDRQTSVWQAKQAMQEFAISNARSQALFNEVWVSNYGMINRNYRNSVLEMSKFYSSVIVPTSSELISQNFALTQQMDQRHSTWVLGAVMMAVGVLASVFAGPIGGAIGGVVGTTVGTGVTAALSALGPSLMSTGLGSATGTRAPDISLASTPRSPSAPDSPGVEFGGGTGEGQQPLMLNDQIHISSFMPKKTA